jgi:5'-deoxynucleotidase YfbR-like HD superfamily hydrolase
MNTTTQLQPTTNRITTIHGAAVQVGIEQLKVIYQQFKDSDWHHMEWDLDEIQHLHVFKLLVRAPQGCTTGGWICHYSSGQICLDDFNAITQLQDVITYANALLGHNVVQFAPKEAEYSQLSNPSSSKLILPPVVAMVSGKTFNLLHPEKSEFDIEDVAHHLSMICRFNGGVTQFYSVAQHSVLVSHLVPSYLAMPALLHDVAEAYLGDCTAPFKQHLREYQQIENNILQNIFNRLGLDYPLHSEIKRADIRARATEVRDLTRTPVDSHTWDHLSGITPSDLQVLPMPQEQAKQAFLKRFFELQATQLNALAKA